MRKDLGIIHITNSILAVSLAANLRERCLDLRSWSFGSLEAKQNEILVWQVSWYINFHHHLMNYQIKKQGLPLLSTELSGLSAFLAHSTSLIPEIVFKEENVVKAGDRSQRSLSSHRMLLRWRTLLRRRTLSRRRKLSRQRMGTRDCCQASEHSRDRECCQGREHCQAGYHCQGWYCCQGGDRCQARDRCCGNPKNVANQMN